MTDEHDSDRFGVLYEDDLEYEFTDAASDTLVKVRIDDFRNGASVGTYHYDASGDRLGYHSFRINNVDQRLLVYLDADEAEDLHDAVARALHAGGWRLKNVHTDRIMPETSDPYEVQMLDLRDHLEALAAQVDVPHISAAYQAMARLADELCLQHTTFEAFGDEDDFDPDHYSTSDLGWLAEREGKRMADLNTQERVEGLFMNAVYPDRAPYSELSERPREILELARTYYREGREYSDAFDQASQEIYERETGASATPE